VLFSKHTPRPHILQQRRDHRVESTWPHCKIQQSIGNHLWNWSEVMKGTTLLSHCKAWFPFKKKLPRSLIEMESHFMFSFSLVQNF
ncbi:hypothetical protein VIGAN_06025700, partial [Vigna angularis var. angularis]